MTIIDIEKKHDDIITGGEEVDKKVLLHTGVSLRAVRDMLEWSLGQDKTTVQDALYHLEKTIIQYG